MPVEETVISVETEQKLLKNCVSVLLQQYGKAERNKLDVAFYL